MKVADNFFGLFLASLGLNRGPYANCIVNRWTRHRRTISRKQEESEDESYLERIKEVY